MTQTGYDLDSNTISWYVALSYILQYCDLAISLLTPLMLVEAGNHAGLRCHCIPHAQPSVSYVTDLYMIM